MSCQLNEPIKSVEMKEKLKFRSVLAQVHAYFFSLFRLFIRKINQISIKIQHQKTC